MAAGQPAPDPGMSQNIALYPWFKFCQSLVFWQAVWFLYFQSRLSAADAPGWGVEIHPEWLAKAEYRVSEV